MKRTSVDHAILKFTHGGRALRAFAKYERENDGPLTHSHVDYLLDNTSMDSAQAKNIAALYRSKPHVARAIAAEKQRDAEVERRLNEATPEHADAG